MAERRDSYRVLTWQVHGAYLEALARTGMVLYLPVTDDGRRGYDGRASLDLPDSVVEVRRDAVRGLQLDAVLYQSADHWLHDREWLLSEEQRRLPAILVEHDPPRQSPTDTRHPVDDPYVLIVHVTAFNALMWDTGRSPIRVVEHGVHVPEEVVYQGDLPRGVTAINNLRSRGRRLGADIFEAWQECVPLDLFGIGADPYDGREVQHSQLPRTMARYRFFCYPVRYTSLSLALIEAMMVGLPVVALATTELPTVIENGRSGFLATDPSDLVAPMRELIADPTLAAALGNEARRVARERFDIRRFAADWQSVMHEVAGRPRSAIVAGGADLGKKAVAGARR